MKKIKICGATFVEGQPNEVKARISVYNGGKWGRHGEYMAIIRPEYYKNGNIKHRDFTLIKILGITKKWYGYSTAKRIESITEIEY